jgi:hypothetical protein
MLRRLPSRRRAVGLFALGAALALPLVAPAGPTLPQRDLIVEWREADAGGTAWGLRSGDAARDRQIQMLRVRNGQRASLRLSVTRPVQTWQAAPGVWRGVAVPTTEWLDAGQALVVEPRWPGDTQPVTIVLRAQAVRFDTPVAPGSAEPPQRGGVQIETTVAVPLGEWVTLATAGAPDASPNTVSSRDAAPSRRNLELRVTTAPR